MPSDRPSRTAAATALALLTLARAPARGDGPPATPDTAAAAARRFQHDRFGLDVEWGVFSLLRRGADVMERDRLPVSEYEKLPPRFNPTEFNADAWVKAVAASGARSLTVTAKHHDGFCLFDSKLTRFDVVDASPYARDPLKALAEACRKHKVALVFAYSLLDWHHPDYAPPGRTGRHAGRDAQGVWARYVSYYQGQVRELCTNYGPIAGVRFDGAWDKPGADWGLAETGRMVRRLQPGALVFLSHRPSPVGDLRPRTVVGPDVVVVVGDEVANDLDRTLPFERLVPLSRGRSGSAPFRSTEEVIRALAGAAGRGENLRVGVAAQADGSLPAEALDRLAGVGRWLASRGVSVVGTRAGPVGPQPWGVTTEPAAADRPAVLYLHVLNPGAPVRLPGVALPFDARVLGATRPLPLRRDGKDVVVELPESDRTPGDTVVVLTPTAPEPARAARGRR